MRTSGVRLIAETRQYKREMRESAQVTRGVRDEVEQTNKASDRLGVGMSRAAGKVRDEVGQTVKATDRLGSGLSRTARGAGHDFDLISRHTGTLKYKIEETEAAIKSLAKGFAATGDTNLLKEIGQQQRFLNQLRKVDKLLPKPAEAAAAGAKMGTQVSQGFGASIRSALPTVANPAFLAVGAGAALAMAPFIGAVVAGAVMGKVGIGGVIGGLTLASKDGRVQGAAKLVADQLQDRLYQAAGGFVQPALDGLARVKRAIDNIDLEGVFADSAQFVAPLVQGVSLLIERVGNAVRRLMGSAGPAIQSISAGIAGIGDAIGDFMDSLADNGVEAGVALRQVFQLVEVTIRGVGKAINALTESYGFLAKLGLFGHDAQLSYLALEASTRAAAVAAKGYTGAAGEAAGATTGLIQPTNAATEAATAHARAMRGEVGALTELNKANRAQIDPLFAFTEAQKKVREAQDKATEAIRKHGANSAQARAATQALSDAALDLQGKAGALSQGFDGRLTPAMRANYRAANLTETQINAVEKQLIEAKKAADKYDGDYRAHVSVPGAADAATKLAQLIVMQKALRKGVSMGNARALAGDEAAARDRNLFHSGGYTGPGGKYEPAGVVHADEFVVRKESRRKIERQHPGLLNEMNATGQVRPGYVRGGTVWPFPATAAITRIPSKSEAMSVVTPSFGNWPSSPSAQRGDSGVWRSIVAMIRATGPMSGSFGNAYRPGDPKWHGSGRAVDWMGFNQDPLARFLAAKRPLELIHRTNKRDYAYTRGKNKGSFNNALMEAHRNHIHIAMANGGVIREPVLGVGASGRTYSFGEGGIPEAVMPLGSGRGGATINYNISVVVPTAVNKADVGREVVSAIQEYERGSGKRWRS